MGSKIRTTATFVVTIVTVLASQALSRAQESQVDLPESDSRTLSSGPKFIYPRIQGHGKVVQLSDAVDQPRDGSKICVDVTAGGPPAAKNPAIEKVARFANIYAGAGARKAEVSITVILHGDATLAVLNSRAYAKNFGLKSNPNLPLFRSLKKAGVEILVCGQALNHKGQTAENVADEVGVAVSALTVNVNRQSDGYAFIPLH